MKFSIEQEILAKGLNLVAKSVSNRATLPALSGVFFELEGESLTLTGNNTELAIKVPLNVKTEEEGDFLVGARLLTDFVNTLPSGLLEISTSSERLNIKAGKNRSDFTGMPIEDYPEINFETQKTENKLPMKGFCEAIDRVGFSASSDDARAILTGVSIKSDNGLVEIAATDGFRLSVEKFKTEATDSKFNIVVPAKVMIELGKTLREYSGENAGNETSNFSCSLSREGTQVVFMLPGQAKLMSRLLEGSYPPYNKIIPTSYATKVVFNIDELIRVVRTASLFARSGSSVVKMNIMSADKLVKLLSATEQVGEFSGEITAEVEGSDNIIAFNSKYLLDFLSKSKSKKVSLEFNGANQSGVWRMEGIENYLHVIMPIRVE